jgi:hypothetical protein
MKVKGANIIVVGAILIFCAYPLFLITDINCVNYLLMNAGAAFILIGGADITRNRIVLISGIVQSIYFFVFAMNIISKDYHWKVFIHSFNIIMGLCILVLLCRSIAKRFF